MELAFITAEKIIEMFLMMLTGCLCSRIGLISDDTNGKLSEILMMLISPCLIFSSYQSEFDPVRLKGLMLALGLAFLSHVLFIVIAALLVRKKEGYDVEIEKLAVIYSNCGFIGIPLVDGVLGAEGVFYITAYITMLNLFIWTHGIMVMSGKGDIKSCIKALKSPCVVAVIMGLGAYLANIQLPSVILEPMKSIGDMNTPLAMIVAGVTIAGSDVKAMVRKARIYYMCFLRLVLCPVVVLLIYKALGLNSIAAITILVASACPTAATGTMFAIRYQKNPVYASELFGMATLLSLVTIPVIMILQGLIMG